MMPRYSKQEAIVMDLVLATGDTACKAFEILRRGRNRSATFICLIASRQGVEKLHCKYPEVRIFTGALDEAPLDENGWTMPGLGNANQRFYGVDPKNVSLL